MSNFTDFHFKMCVLAMKNEFKPEIRRAIVQLRNVVKKMSGWNEGEFNPGEKMILAEAFAQIIKTQYSHEEGDK